MSERPAPPELVSLAKSLMARLDAGEAQVVPNIISQEADDNPDLPECPRYLSKERGMDGTPHPASYKWLKAKPPRDDMRVCSLCGYPIRVPSKPSL